MELTVLATDDPSIVLTTTRHLLARDPVRANVVLTLLHARVDHPGPGRYWVPTGPDGPAGVVFQSPLDFAATITPMPGAAPARARACAVLITWPG